MEEIYYTYCFCKYCLKEASCTIPHKPYNWCEKGEWNDGLQQIFGKYKHSLTEYRKDQGIILLTKQNLKQILSFFALSKLLCVRCGNELREGNIVIRRRSSHYPKYYHIRCYESMFV